MLRLLADENFNAKIVRGLLRALPALDLVTIQEVGLSGTPDAQVLEWAAGAGRVLLTHDVRTMRAFVRERVEAGRPMPGVIEVSASFPIGQAIDEIVLIAECSQQDEWANLVVRVPL